MTDTSDRDELRAAGQRQPAVRPSRIPGSIAQEIVKTL